MGDDCAAARVAPSFHFLQSLVTAGRRRLLRCAHARKLQGPKVPSGREREASWPGVGLSAFINKTNFLASRFQAHLAHCCKRLMAARLKEIVRATLNRSLIALWIGTSRYFVTTSGSIFETGVSKRMTPSTWLFATRLVYLKGSLRFWFFVTFVERLGEVIIYK